MNEDKTPRIALARITRYPVDLWDPMPQVIVNLDNNLTKDITLFEFYPDEIMFDAEEFIGLTEAEARELKFRKDKRYLTS